MRLADSATVAGFWLGTLLPVAYVPIVFLGIDSVGMLTLFVGLLAIHVLALVVGHDYPDSRPQ
ncbi:hypothetical protein [Natrarchaeobius chitinivorans]|uniref:Cytochrome-ba3 oxidase subunit n=1 Tax=Natrarchaeobius chitinivorans TaxID=1679083 RepID=A0A3N6P3R6_NATCH|nr:hypothetical protein [Natrarchaeobius chitinivorans]RQG92429.1 hypothetical protein EA473_16785 [Natrarchaeobius chitinivorans]